MVTADTSSPARSQPPQPDVDRTHGRPRLLILLRAATAAASGLAQLLALPPYELWALAPFSAALLAGAVAGTRLRRAAWLGLLSGAALMFPLVVWQDVFGVDVWLVIAAAETLYYIPMAMGIALVMRLPGWVAWVPALWVAQEFVRARFPLGGFPWGKLAFSQPETPFTGYAAWGSSPLVTFMVALTGTVLLWGATRLRSPHRPGGARAVALPASVAVAGVVAILAVGTVAPRVAAPTPDHQVTVALVQGDVPRVAQMSILGRRMQVLRNHVDGVHELARQVRAGQVEQPDLVILPENSSDIDAYAEPRAAEMIQQAAEDIDAPLLFGIGRYSQDGATRQIRSVVWTPQEGPTDYYVKRYLVPFGEYIPFRELATSVVSRLEQIGSDAVPGTEPGALPMGETTVATAICFDVAFDRPLRESVVEGGQILAVPTNNANYNFTGQPEQQLAITRLRAVEHGRPAVVAATSGLSAIVRPDGSVTYRSPEAEPAVHVATVTAMSGLTPATRLGSVPEVLLTLIAAGAVVAAGVGERRSPRAAGPPPSAPDTSTAPPHS
ncbi:apolipoprotein N-acyltransferase [Salinactinospora qingdaonensis]|uniref:Apolipoprotein N-acyltransferase n=1 Tax=Salinactinospora qingdaonensis TaxID=702744 RepID=A0ABP7F256_9ACTN